MERFEKDKIAIGEGQPCRALMNDPQHIIITQIR